MSNASSNLSNANVSLLSNNPEGLNEIEKKIREQARLDIFKSLDLDKRNFTDIIETISEIEELDSNPGGKIKLSGRYPLNYDTLKTEKFYKHIFDKYEGKDEEKEKMYMELAERVILARGGVVEYKHGRSIGKDTINEDFVKKEYEILNKEYDEKLDFFTLKDKEDGKLYIIKWKADELKAIKEREDELKNQQIEKLKNENNGTNLDNAEGENVEETQEEDKKNNKMEELIKSLMEDSKKKDKEIEEQNARITELERLLQSKEKNFEDEDDDNNLEHTETLDENPNYILRSDIEGLVFGIRGAEGYPKGTIKIKEEIINVEEFEFYEEFKQEYIEAKGDTTKLSRLDKEFSEMIILFSPNGTDYEDRFCIKLSERELKDGLYVSDERLARYGISIKAREFEKVIEKEVIRERKIIQKIEIEIREVTSVIEELSQELKIEGYDSETILKEIGKKKNRLKQLFRRQKELLASLNGLHKTITKIVDDTEKQNGDVLCEFEDSDGDIFYSECKTNSIRRRDGKEILPKGSIDTAAEYIDSEGRILRLTQVKSAEDDGYDNPIAKYKFLYTGKKQIEEKLYNKERKGLGVFDAGKKGELFFIYCKDHGISRKDGKEINQSLFDQDYMDVVYVDSNGKELKLEYSAGADEDGDEGSHTKYEFAYYEGNKYGEDKEIGSELEKILIEQETLLRELEELEEKLKLAKAKDKRDIEEKIRVINGRLAIITKKITEFTSMLHHHKTPTTTKTKYGIYTAMPAVIPQVQQTGGLKLNSVISDMGADVFVEKAALKAEEELKRQYEGLGIFNLRRRQLFFSRGALRQKLMRNEMNNISRTAFLTDSHYAALNEQSQNAADRHGHELLTGMEAINKISTVNNPQIDQLCKDYLNNAIDDTRFQQEFNTIVEADTNIQNALNGQRITHIGTNILLQLKEQKALNTLITALDSQLTSYQNTRNTIHLNNMQSFVEKYIKDYQKLPAFKTFFEQFLQGDVNAETKLRRYLTAQKAAMNMQIANLTMDIDIVNKGKSAYQIDNKDREKGWRYRLGHFLDKNGLATVAGTLAIYGGLTVATGGLGTAAAAAISTGTFGAYAGFLSYIKKGTHYTKEQNTHEKNMTTDYRNELKRIQDWQNSAINGSLRKKYKAKRQLALLDQTTQENIKLSDQITEYITNLSSKSGALTPDENNFMNLNLIEGWARLKYYREMGHNFLASENVDKTENDMKRLEKSITLGLQKIGKTTNDIEQNMSGTNSLGENITYNVIQNELKASYDKSLIQFKRERKNLALKYGIGAAAVSIGFSTAFQYFTDSGMFSGRGAAPTVSYKGGTDNFTTLGGENLSNGNVYNSTKSAIVSSKAPTGSELTFNYSVGTDGTRVVSSFNPAGKLSALSTDFSNGSLYPNLSPAQVTSLKAELSKIMTDPSFASAFKDSNLAKMRAMESLEHFARALNDSSRPDLVLNFNHSGSIAGLTPRTVGERFMTGSIDIKPLKNPAGWYRRVIGLPLFFNTFKKRKSSKDSTDQNWGINNGNQNNNVNQNNNGNQP